LGARLRALAGALAGARRARLRRMEGAFAGAWKVYSQANRRRG
jgi:hypothetical protein